MAKTAIRETKGKPRFDLLPLEWSQALVLVLTRGALKYDDRNWELGMKWSRCWASMFRHAFKFATGQRYDKETGCHHMAHVAWNALALMSYDIRGVGENDLNVNPEWLAAVAEEPAEPIQKVKGD
jgi:hypothetical protein